MNYFRNATRDALAERILVYLKVKMYTFFMRTPEVCEQAVKKKGWVVFLSTRAVQESRNV